MFCSVFILLFALFYLVYTYTHMNVYVHISLWFASRLFCSRQQLNSIWNKKILLISVSVWCWRATVQAIGGNRIEQRTNTNIFI